MRITLLLSGDIGLFGRELALLLGRGLRRMRTVLSPVRILSGDVAGVALRLRLLRRLLGRKLLPPGRGRRLGTRRAGRARRIPLRVVLRPPLVTSGGLRVASARKEGCGRDRYGKGLTYEESPHWPSEPAPRTMNLR